jgi:hypothetical protein
MRGSSRCRLANRMPRIGGSTVDAVVSSPSQLARSPRRTAHPRPRPYHDEPATMARACSRQPPGGTSARRSGAGVAPPRRRPRASKCLPLRTPIQHRLPVPFDEFTQCPRDTGQPSPRRQPLAFLPLGATLAVASELVTVSPVLWPPNGPPGKRRAPRPQRPPEVSADEATRRVRSPHRGNSAAVIAARRPLRRKSRPPMPMTTVVAMIPQRRKQLRGLGPTPSGDVAYFDHVAPGGIGPGGSPLGRPSVFRIAG